jgi:hypothetical protein
MAKNVESDHPARSLLRSLAVLVISLAVLLGAYLYGQWRASRGLLPAFESQAAKERLAAAMQFQLHAAAEAEKNAVMADTDEASEKFAQEARRASAAVEEDRQELGRLIEADHWQDEAARFTEFSEAWQMHEELDREILGLAVENTNLKAMKLSFGPASEALQRMEMALHAVVAEASSSTDPASIQMAASQALIAALKIHAIQARHIAEPQDAEMDRIETEMKTLDEKVNQALSTIAAAGESFQPAADEAQAAYADFQKLNAQILELSRRNSNVRSAAISLGEKRLVTAQCRDLLGELQKSIQSNASTATR